MLRCGERNAVNQHKWCLESENKRKKHRFYHFWRVLFSYCWKLYV